MSSRCFLKTQVRIESNKNVTWPWQCWNFSLSHTAHWVGTQTVWQLLRNSLQFQSTSNVPCKTIIITDQTLWIDKRFCELTKGFGKNLWLANNIHATISNTMAVVCLQFAKIFARNCNKEASWWSQL